MMHCNAEPARSKQLDKVVAAADDIIAQVIYSYNALPVSIVYFVYNTTHTR
jgi:hypothetical protein